MADHVPDTSGDAVGGARDSELVNAAVADAKAEFGRRIRAARLAKGWTQVQLADALGLHSVTISLVESGQNEVGVTKAARMAAVLGVSLDDLTGSPEPGIEPSAVPRD